MQPSALVGATEEPAAIPEPMGDAVAPERGLNHVDVLVGGPSAEKPFGAPPSGYETDENPEHTSNTRSSTVEAVADSELAGTVDEDRSADTPDAPAPKVEESAVDEGGLFPPGALPIFPTGRDDKATPPGKTTNEDTAPPNRSLSEQRAACRYVVVLLVAKRFPGIHCLAIIHNPPRLLGRLFLTPVIADWDVVNNQVWSTVIASADWHAR